MPGLFLALPDFRPLQAGSRTVVLDGALIYRDERGRVWTIPSGTATDLASVPRWVPGLARLTFRGPLETGAPAVFHDGLYQGVALVAQGTGPSVLAEVTRAEADALFYEALRAAGEHALGAWVMWAGVRVGGWWPWSEHRDPEDA